MDFFPGFDIVILGGEEMKETVYLETSVVSYYTARPARDVVVLAHQEITRQWWKKAVNEYEIFSI